MKFAHGAAVHFAARSLLALFQVNPGVFKLVRRPAGPEIHLQPAPISQVKDITTARDRATEWCRIFRNELRVRFQLPPGNGSEKLRQKAHGTGPWVVERVSFERTFKWPRALTRGRLRHVSPPDVPAAIGVSSRA